MKLTRVVLFLAVFLISGREPFVDTSLQKPRAPLQRLYVKSNGWHTGFIVPAAALQKAFPQLKQRFSDTPFLEVGWGDKGFYLADQVTAGITLAAMFWSPGTVIHLVAVPATVEAYFPHSQLQKLCVTEQDYAQLIQFIVSSFYQNDAGQLVPLKKGLYGNSQFYQATGHYHLFNTCNKWTATGLHQAGLAIDPLLKLSANNVMNYLQAQNRALSNSCL
jgi:uncharacterized protein (TIGR02117 family)